MGDLYTTAFLIFGGLLLYRLWPRIDRAWRRFDRENRARIAEQQRDLTDPVAHFRHTLGIAGEQVEEVSECPALDPRTGMPVTRYLFEGVTFATRREAEQARADKIRAIARGFYMELPSALASRKEDGKLR